MPPILEDVEEQLASTHPDRLVMYPRVFRGVNLLLQVIPFVVWDYFHQRASLHTFSSVLDSLDLMLNGVEIDRRRGKVTVIRHLKVRRSRPLSDFQQLLIGRDDQGRYALSLLGPSGPFNLLTFRRYLDTRRSAERIAMYLGCDIGDEALGNRILGRRPRDQEPRSNEADEDALQDSSAPEADETLATLLRASEHNAEVWRIDHEENPGNSLVFAIALLLSPAVVIVVAVLVPALVSLAAIALAVGVAAAILSHLYRRSGVIFVRDADWCIAWRFFKTTRFARRLPLSQYTEVILHAEERWRDNENVNPYADRREGTLGYAICLDGQTEPLEIRLASDLTSARKLAATVANFIGLDFRDFTE